ncbi:uncharacterized protein LOC134710430 [Mytilus trossulus]|uniref:uncharacterized protein LOC134710430 n=1 Tax=Mytilus trossulus TaxID=6551 RepID=UPI0030060312
MAIFKKVANLFSCTKDQTQNATSKTPAVRSDDPLLKKRSPWKRIIRGSCSQADVKNALYENNQCTSIAVTAAMYHAMKCVNKWKSKDIDTVIKHGDGNHVLFREDFRFSDKKDGRVAIFDLPMNFTVRVKDQKAVVMKTGEWGGPVFAPVGYDDEFRFSCPTLRDVLEQQLKPNRSVLTTIDVYSLLFMKVGTDIWLFDSHSRNRKGKGTSFFGKAFAAPFSSMDDLEKYIRKNYGTDDLNYNATSIKIWLPNEYASRDKAIVRSLEHKLKASALEKLCAKFAKKLQKMEAERKTVKKLDCENSPG